MAEQVPIVQEDYQLLAQEYYQVLIQEFYNLLSPKDDARKSEDTASVRDS